MPIRVPALGGNISAAEFLAWLKAPGDRVRTGEVLFEVETDKAIISVLTVRSGRILTCSQTAGVVEVGQVVGTMRLCAGVDEPGEAPGGVAVGRYEHPRPAARLL